MRHLSRSGFSPYGALPVEEVPGARPTPSSALGHGSGGARLAEGGGSAAAAAGSSAQAPALPARGGLGGGVSVRAGRPELSCPRVTHRPPAAQTGDPCRSCALAGTAPRPGRPRPRASRLGASGRLSPPLAAPANGAARPPRPACAGQWHQLVPPAAPGRTGKGRL